MWRIVLLAALLTMLSVGVSKAAPFPDVPGTHWASSAVQQLKAKGILEGYPDGLYRGKRAASRYELAMVASRIVAKLEQMEASLPDFNQFATKEELAAVKRMVDLNSQKIEELGIRVDALEKKVAELDNRLTKLERITFTGHYEAVYVNQGLEADQIGNIQTQNATFIGHRGWSKIFFFEPTMAYTTAKVGWNYHEVKPWDNYLWKKGWNALPISTTVGMNDVSYLNIHGKISNNWKIKAVVSGENLLAQKGVTNPTELNKIPGSNFSSSYYADGEEGSWIRPYTKKSHLRYHSIFTDYNGIYVIRIIPENGLYLESLSLHNEDGNLSFTLGGFNPKLVDGSVFAGPEVPYLWQGDNFFAVDGFHVHHKLSNPIFGATLEYEVYGGATSKIDTIDERNANGYIYGMTQRVFGVTAKFGFQKGHFRLSYNVIEDSQEEWIDVFSVDDVSGITVAPFGLSTLGWEWTNQDDPILEDPMFDGKYGDAGDLTVIGPQYQSTIGADFRYNINERFSFEGRFATSRYLPVKELGLDTNGSMFSAKLHGTFGNATEAEFEKEGLKPRSGHFCVEYLSVDPDYSPFIGIQGRYFATHSSFSGLYRGNLFTIGYYDNRFWAQLPYPVYMSIYDSNLLTYTAHNAKMYPNNREGIRINVQYKFSDAFLGWARFESLDQKEAARDVDGSGGSTIGWGYYEPIFGTTTNDLGLDRDDVVKKGQIRTFNAGFNYKFQGGKFDFTGQYYNTDVKRDIPANANNSSDHIDYTVTSFDAMFRYMSSEKLTWHIAYTSVQSDGKYLVAQNVNSENMTWEANALRIGVDWKVNEDVNMFANYRFLNFDTKTYSQSQGSLVMDNGDWKGTQFWFGARVKFGQK